MAKPDYAHRMTDAELAQLERRISAIYQQAADELSDTVNAYFEQFEKRDAAMKDKLGGDMASLLDRPLPAGN